MGETVVHIELVIMLCLRCRAWEQDGVVDWYNLVISYQVAYVSSSDTEVVKVLYREFTEYRYVLARYAPVDVASYRRRPY